MNDKTGTPSLRTLVVAGIAIAVAVAAPRPASAYVDPGTGSFLVQGIIAALVGAGVAVKMFWGRIKSGLTGRKPPRDDDDDA